MIVTDRLTLRPLRPEDANWIATEIARPEVHHWLTTPPYPYSLTDAHEFIARVGGQPGHRVIDVLGAPTGVVSISVDKDEQKEPELGFWLRQAAWGQGTMTDAVRAMLDWHFAGCDVIDSGWIEGNAASENVHRKLGFRTTGETRQTWSHFYGCNMPVIRVRLDRASWADVDRAAGKASAKEGKSS